MSAPRPIGPPPEPAPLDLAQILELGPPQRKALLDLNRISVASLGIGEILALAEAAGVAPDELGAAMSERAPVGVRAQVVVALAWIVARRAEPDLTMAEVQTWALEVRGKPADPTPAVAVAGRSRRPRNGPRPVERDGSSDSGA